MGQFSTGVDSNGRIARLLADVMAVQAGLGPLDYSLWESHRSHYIQAIQQGLMGDYQSMRTWVERIVPEIEG